jgi:hypothetical protein
VTETVVCVSVRCDHERRACRGCPVLTCRWALDERGECCACEWRRNRASRVSAADARQWGRFDGGWGGYAVELREPVAARRRAA